MTSKLKAMWGSVAAGVSAILAGLNLIPNSLQDRFIQTLQAIFPVAWRPELLAIFAFITVCAGIYAVTHAAKSGPQSEPVNSPKE